MTRSPPRLDRPKPAKLLCSRALRKRPTEAEAAAWEVLRDRQFGGLKFRRQQVIDGFIVDFYCRELGLVIELDGGVHDDPDQARRDAERRECFERRGLREVRLRNEEVSRAAFERIVAMVQRERATVCRAEEDSALKVAYPGSVSWLAVDTQQQLDELQASVCWDDSRVVEFHGGQGPRSYYPSDVSRSGYSNPDVHVLIDTCAGSPFLELCLIHCDRLGAEAFERLHLRGRVDSLKRVTVYSSDDSTLFRCARLIYRWLEEAPFDGTYYFSR